jgi:hypothetical protein
MTTLILINKFSLKKFYIFNFNFYFRPSVILFEITVTWDGRLDAARQEKNVKYAELMAKISRQCPVQVK